MTGSDGSLSGRSTDDGRMSDERNDSPKQQERSLAEWVTLAISLTIVVGLLGLITYLYIDDGQASAAIGVTPLVEKTRRTGDRYIVPIEVSNTGGRTVEQLLVTVSLTLPDSSSEDAQFAIDFLAGGATQDAVASFSEDPREHDVSVGAVSYIEP